MTVTARCFQSLVLILCFVGHKEIFPNLQFLIVPHGSIFKVVALMAKIYLVSGVNAVAILTFIEVKGWA